METQGEQTCKDCRTYALTTPFRAGSYVFFIGMGAVIFGTGSWFWVAFGIGATALACIGLLFGKMGYLFRDAKGKFHTHLRMPTLHAVWERENFIEFPLWRCARRGRVLQWERKSPKVNSSQKEYGPYVVSVRASRSTWGIGSLSGFLRKTEVAYSF